MLNRGSAFPGVTPTDQNPGQARLTQPRREDPHDGRPSLGRCGFAHRSGYANSFFAIARSDRVLARLDRPNRFVLTDRVIHSSFPRAGSRHSHVAEALDPSAPAVYENETWCV